MVQRFKNEIVAVAVSLWGLYLRVKLVATNPPGADGDSLWQVGFLSAMSSFWDLLKNLPKADHAGYLAGDFILIYPFFKMFGNNQWGLVAPHLIAALAGFYFLYLICRMHFQTVWGYLISFLIVAFNWNLIFHSVEIRTYAVLPTLALMSLYFCLDLVNQNVNMSLKKKFVAGLCLILVIWFHAYGVLMVFCTALFAVLSKSRDKDFGIIFKDMFKFFSVVLLIAMPLWCYSVFGPHFSASKESFVARNIGTFDYIPNPAVELNRFLRTVFGNLMGFKKFKPLVNGILIAGLLPQKNRFKQAGFFFLVIIFPIQLILLSDVMKSYWFIQRQFVWVMPLYAFFIGWCWDSVFVYVSQKSSVKKWGNTLKGRLGFKKIVQV